MQKKKSLLGILSSVSLIAGMSSTSFLNCLPVYAETTTATEDTSSSSAATQETTTTTTTETTSGSGSASTDSGYTWPDSPSVVSGQAILMDADTGAILYEKNAYKRNYPASTTKIVTGLLVAQNASLSETVTFSSEAANSVVEGDSTLSTKAGEQYTVEQAMAGLLLYSANEIAYGLAEHVSGSLDAFAEKMNQVAKDAGCLDTHFVNASGLYNENHYSTPYDMALIARTCFNNPTFLSIDSLETYTIPATNKTSEARTFTNRNQLLPGLAYGYKYCVGGKTGYLPEGGYTYVSYAEKDGMRLIAVCFDSTEFGRFTDAEKLFKWGYSNFSKVSLTDSNLTSSYSDASYLNSTRFVGSSINRTFDASFVTLPNSASISSVVIAKDTNHGVQTDESGINIPVVFSYGTHTVGTANLDYKSSSSVAADQNLLPLLTKNKTASYSTSHAFVIDLRILIAIGIAGLIAYIIVHRRNKARAKQEELENRRKRKRKR